MCHIGALVDLSATIMKSRVRFPREECFFFSDYLFVSGRACWEHSLFIPTRSRNLIGLGTLLIWYGVDLNGLNLIPIIAKIIKSFVFHSIIIIEVGHILAFSTQRTCIGSLRWKCQYMSNFNLILNDAVKMIMKMDLKILLKTQECRNN